VARRATIIAQEREKSGFLLVLDAGDGLAADQEPAHKTQGRSSIAAMNLMGYDAMVLGPKDLALGLGAVLQREIEAEFALLSADAVVAATGESVVAPYVLREFDGHTVAIVGLSGGSDGEEIAVRDPVETVREVVAKVETHADVIILLSHADTSTNQQIAEAVPGIDLIISGGKLQLADPWRSEKTGTLILHADEATPGHAGRMLGVARLAFDAEGLLVGHSWQRLKLGPEIADDPAMATWIQGQMGR
jgi:2',3'-cyclic-nucleotide 2'-phosphodiesterase (5'-nucleotidase family)